MAGAKAAQTAGAAATGSFTLEQVMSYPFSSELVAAKTGERIAWVMDLRGVRNVWVADGPDFAARQVTHYNEDDGQEIDSLRLTPDGQTIVYSRGSETNGQGEVADPSSNVRQPHQQVWAAAVSNGQPRLLGTMECNEEDCEDIELSPDGQWAVWPARRDIWIAPLTGTQPAHKLFYARGNNVSPRWSPDGKAIVFASERGDHSLIGLYRFGANHLRYIAPDVDRDMMPRWSPDGRQIAFIRIHGLRTSVPLIPIEPLPFSLWVADAETLRARPLWKSGDAMDDSLPYLTEDDTFHFTGDGRIIFASEQDGWNHIYSIAADGPLGTAATLLTAGKYDVKDVSVSPDNLSVYYSANPPLTPEDVDRRHIMRVGVAAGPASVVSSGASLEWTPVVTGDGRQILALGSTAQQPPLPVRLTGHTRDVIARAVIPTEFPEARLVAPKQVVFTTSDGFTIHCQLFVPPGRTGPGPALIYMHGGSMRQMMLGWHSMDYYANGYAENQYLVSRGYVVLSVNYRTGIMYGRHFRVPANAGWRGASEYTDIREAGQLLAKMPIADPAKIGLWGGSYGGFLTAMGLAKNSDIFKAGVDMHGVHDWSFEMRHWGRFGPEAPDLKEAQQLAFESSPDAYVGTWRSPVLLIQGDDDRNVPFSQTVDLAQRLRVHHVGFETLVLPDEIHGFLRWHSWVRAYAAGADFFDRVLKEGQQIPIH
jgi:dipeptidyl aminopeptidase/acylaminoacyl peptidase